MSTDIDVDLKSFMHSPILFTWFEYTSVSFGIRHYLYPFWDYSTQNSHDKVYSCLRMSRGTSISEGVFRSVLVEHFELESKCILCSSTFRFTPVEKLRFEEARDALLKRDVQIAMGWEKKKGAWTYG